MDSEKRIAWILRIAIAGEFIGHGAFALQGKQAWITWIQQFIPVEPAQAGSMLFIIGLMDIAAAIIILVKPFPIVLLWAAFWGFWTALVRPLVGESFWDFVERWTNWGAPLALFFLQKKNSRKT